VTEDVYEEDTRVTAAAVAMMTDEGRDRSRWTERRHSRPAGYMKATLTDIN